LPASELNLSPTDKEISVYGHGGSIHIFNVYFYPITLFNGVDYTHFSETVQATERCTVIRIGMRFKIELGHKTTANK
jgi:hypothetical protein